MKVVSWRFLQVPIGKANTAADNRTNLSLLAVVSGDAASLPDDATVQLPFDMLSYPHLIFDEASSQFLVRVVANGHACVRNVTVQSFLKVDYYEAFGCLKALTELLNDDTIELVTFRPPYGFASEKRARHELHGLEERQDA